jgi:CBS domain-containing protein
MSDSHYDIQYVLKHFYKVPVETVMSKDVWNMPMVPKNAPIEDVLSIMTARRHVWVMEKKGSRKVVGVITEKDLLEIMAPKRIQPYVIGGIDLTSLLLGNVRTAEDVMCKKLIVAHPKETIEDVLDKMRSFKLRRLPVVDKHNNLLGEITIKILIIQFRKVLKWYRITKD